MNLTPKKRYKIITWCVMCEEKELLRDEFLSREQRHIIYCTTNNIATHTLPLSIKDDVGSLCGLCDCSFLFLDHTCPDLLFSKVKGVRSLLHFLDNL
jgi:hypothetical protein